MRILKKISVHTWVILTLVITVVMDLFTKYLIELYFKPHETMNVIGSFIQLILIYNKGGVFGIAQGKTAFFLIVSVFVLIFIFYTYFTNPEKSPLFQVSIGLVLGGALGNMYERVFSENGVVDFVYIGWDKYATIFGYKLFLRWPAFNVADAAIMVGAVILAVILWKSEHLKKIQEENRDDIQDSKNVS